jgi:hypothetical protein
MSTPDPAPDAVPPAAEASEAQEARRAKRLLFWVVVLLVLVNVALIVAAMGWLESDGESNGDMPPAVEEVR